MLRTQFEEELLNLHNQFYEMGMANWKIFLPPNYKPATECYMSRKDLANAIRALSNFQQALDF